MFGTLVSLAPLEYACETIAPGRGSELAARWRVRQLEASWLRTAMERWADFDTVTRDALDTTIQEFGIPTVADARRLPETFMDLPPVADAATAVRRLHDAGVGTGILSNASRTTLDHVADRLDLPIDHRLSVDTVRAFKPHPTVYHLAVDATGLPAERIGFVTANGWDAAGATVFGFRVAWIRSDSTARLPAVGLPEPPIATWAEIPGMFT